MAKELAHKIAAQSFRDLIVWQKSIQLATAIDRLTRDFPREELYGLTSQIRRSLYRLPATLLKVRGG
jgi:hypothetical protein